MMLFVAGCQSSASDSSVDFKLEIGFHVQAIWIVIWALIGYFTTRFIQVASKGITRIRLNKRMDRGVSRSDNSGRNRHSKDAGDSS